VYSAVYGCELVCILVVVIVACRESLALPPYTKMSASSVRRSRHGNRTRGRLATDACQPHDGLIVSNKAWCARADNGLLVVYMYNKSNDNHHHHLLDDLGWRISENSGETS